MGMGGSGADAQGALLWGRVWDLGGLHGSRHRYWWSGCATGTLRAWLLSLQHWQVHTCVPSDCKAVSGRVPGDHRGPAMGRSLLCWGQAGWGSLGPHGESQPRPLASSPHTLSGNLNLRGEMLVPQLRPKHLVDAGLEGAGAPMRGKARSGGRKEPECSATTPPLTAVAPGLSSLGLGFTVFGTCELRDSESVMRCLLAPGSQLGGDNIQVPGSLGAELRAIPCSPPNHPNHRGPTLERRTAGSRTSEMLRHQCAAQGELLLTQMIGKD